MTAKQSNFMQFLGIATAVVTAIVAVVFFAGTLSGRVDDNTSEIVKLRETSVSKQRFDDLRADITSIKSDIKEIRVLISKDARP